MIKKDLVEQKYRYYLNSLKNQLVIYLDSYGLMRCYFDEDGWKTCGDAMTRKKSVCTCENCGSLISKCLIKGVVNALIPLDSNFYPFLTNNA